jgi:hypothetical protein
VKEGPCGYTQVAVADVHEQLAIEFAVRANVVIEALGLVADLEGLQLAEAAADPGPVLCAGCQAPTVPTSTRKPQSRSMTSNRVYWALSPGDWPVHLIDPYALRPFGQYAARCGNTMLASAALCRVAPGHRCPGSLR